MRAMFFWTIGLLILLLSSCGQPPETISGEEIEVYTVSSSGRPLPVPVVYRLDGEGWQAAASPEPGRYVFPAPPNSRYSVAVACNTFGIPFSRYLATTAAKPAGCARFAPPRRSTPS